MGKRSGQDDAFVDYYTLLECSPESSLTDLKRAYHEKLREFHPDKRPNSSEGTGQRVTQTLNEAWEVLQDPSKRKVYDTAWQQWRLKSRPPLEIADGLRREGNALYKVAQALQKEGGPDGLSSALPALQKFQAAVGKYSEGIAFAPEDYRIYSNRALCFAALQDWARCQEDALRTTQIKPDFMKGWFLLAKAKWKQGCPIQAQRILDSGLAEVPGNYELLALLEEMRDDLETCKREGLERLPNLPSNRRGRAASRNVSPACTPGQSRVATPPPIPGASRSPGPRGKTSRSVSPAPGQKPGIRRDNTGEFGEATANFGCSAPVPPAGATYAAGAKSGAAGNDADSFGTFGSPAPPRQAPPPGASTPPKPPPGPGPPPGANCRDPTPPRGRVTLSGMAAASRRTGSGTRT